MADIVTAVYQSEDAVTNVYDDLIATGIPDEKIRVDKGKHQVQVMTPEEAGREIEEVLNRHDPVSMHR